MTDLPVHHTAKGSRGRYWTHTEEGEAELVYSVEDDAMIINHAYVPPSARDGRAALSLLGRAMDDARHYGRRIVPLCPTIARFFDRQRGASHSSGEDLALDTAAPKGAPPPHGARDPVDAPVKLIRS